MFGFRFALPPIGRWLLLWLLATVALWAPEMVHAEPGVCSRLMSSLDERNLKGDSVKTAQQNLVALGYRPDGIDGIYGPRTRLSMALFCADAQYAQQSDLLNTLSTHVELTQQEPNWRQTLSSRDFATWLNARSDASELRRIRDSGQTAQVIALLRLYGGRSQSTGAQHITHKDNNAVSYMLSADDIKQMETLKTILDTLSKLLANSYDDKDAFQTAALNTLKTVPNARDYVEQLSSYGHQRTGYMLSAASFKALGSTDVPDYVLDVIQDLQDSSFPGNELEQTLKASLSKLSERALALQSDLVKLTELKPTGAVFSETAIKQYADAHKDDGLIQAVVADLNELLGQRYSNDKALSQAVKKVLQSTSNDILGSSDTILEHAEESSGYGFSKLDAQKALAQLRKDAVPEACLSLISGLSNVDYPSQSLFEKSVQARLEMSGSSNLTRVAIFADVDKPGMLKEKSYSELNDAIRSLSTQKTSSYGSCDLKQSATLNSDAVTTLGGKVWWFEQDLLQALKKSGFSDTVLQELCSVAYHAYGSNSELRTAINKQLDSAGSKQYSLYKDYLPQISAQARKVHTYVSGQAIQLTSDCHCVRSNLSGQVLGFYPYWLAGVPQAVDFSVLSRLNYYGLSFDDQGKLLQTERWNGIDAQFIHEARRHGTKVDLVVQRGEWLNWNHLSSEQKRQALLLLAEGIDEQINIPLDDLSSKLKPYLSFGTAPVPSRGDGVTLYFDAYPTDSGSVDAFTAFIRSLSEKLQARERNIHVNLMFNSAHLQQGGAGIYQQSYLVRLLHDLYNSHLSGKIIVLLQEPTTEDKKLLRKAIEDGLTGRDRMKLLRDLVMVVSYDGKNEEQLENDIIYANDNFGGVGFWPLSFTTEGKATESVISQALLENYRESGQASPRDELNVCRYICPNRWAFRVIWDLLGLALVITVLLYVINCQWRYQFQQYFIYIIVALVIPFLLITFGMLFCDPYLKNVSRDNVLPILMCVLIVGYAIWNYQQKKQMRNLP